MELQQNLDLIYDVDAVLRGQGADAAVLRDRRPALVEIAERARMESLTLLAPKVVYQEFAVAGVQHERLLLKGGRMIESKLLASQLATASKVIILLATIGEELEERATRIWDNDMVYALALDGAGSAAVEALTNAACQYFETEAAKKGLVASIPFSPGMMDWPVDEGQPEIFHLLGDEGTIVQLTPNHIMVPKKSLTMVMGFGTEIKAAGKTCDYCLMRLTCRYQNHYATKP